LNKNQEEVGESAQKDEKVEEEILRTRRSRISSYKFSNSNQNGRI
jgi:hypothetical protein